MVYSDMLCTKSIMEKNGNILKYEMLKESERSHSIDRKSIKLSKETRKEVIVSNF